MRAYYQDVISEYFDMSDRNTRTILLSIDEADQNSVLLSLTNKLYGMIIDKTTDIDFGSIPETKGDVQALDSYDKIRDCIDTLTKIMQEYKQPTETIDTIRAALDNIENDAGLYKKGFMIKSDIIMVTYNTMVLSVVSSLSYLIACTIEYIKTSSNVGYSVVFNRAGLARTKDSLVYENLVAFNRACASGQIHNAFGGLIKAKVRNFAVAAGTLSAIAAGIALAGLLMNILPIVRELTYFFFAIRTRISQYFDLQADLLEMNIQGIEANEVSTVEEKKVVIARQAAIAAKFRKIAEFFMVEVKAADKNSSKELQADSKQLDVNDVVDSKPDSANTYGNTLF